MSDTEHRNLPVLLTVAEVSEILGYHPQHVYRLIRERKLPAKWLGSRTVRVTAADLQGYIDGLEDKNPNAIVRRKIAKRKGGKQ